MSPEEEGKVSLALYDTDGSAIASIDSLALRELDPGALKLPARAREGLLGIEWQELSSTEQGTEIAAETWRLKAGSEKDPAEAALGLCETALEKVKAHLGQEETQALAILTEGALATSDEESPDPALASVWGLIRSAQSEHPGRLVLIDSDGSEASEQAIELAIASGEPQLALRGGRCWWRGQPPQGQSSHPPLRAPGAFPQGSVAPSIPSS